MSMTGLRRDGLFSVSSLFSVSVLLSVFVPTRCFSFSIGSQLGAWNGGVADENNMTFAFGGGVSVRI